MTIIIKNSDKSFAITDIQLPWWATAEDIENLYRAINDYISDKRSLAMGRKTISNNQMVYCWMGQI